MENTLWFIRSTECFLVYSGLNFAIIKVDHGLRRQKMRMRNKPWAKPVLDECPYFYDDPFRPNGAWQNCFAKRQPMHLELGWERNFHCKACRRASGN